MSTLANTRTGPAGRCGFIVLLLGLAGCASGPPLADWPVTHGTPAVVRDVPFFPQERYQCGPAALAEVLGWSGLAVTPQELVPKVYLPAREGSLQAEIIAQARAYGRLAHEIGGPDALLEELDAGHPVLVLQNNGLEWAPQWHYAVVLGHDPWRRTVLLHSGTRANYVLDRDTFNQTWRRGGYWGLVVLPPGELPASATALSYARAVNALEQVNPDAAVLAAWRAGYRRWPYELVIGFGFANALLLRERHAEAERVYRDIILRFPDSAVVWNNLALALAGQGRWEEAEAAAQRAVAMGGPHAESFRDTLDDVRARRVKSARDVQ